MQMPLVIGGTATEKSLNVSDQREIVLIMNGTSIKVIVKNQCSHLFEMLFLMGFQNVIGGRTLSIGPDSR